MNFRPLLFAAVGLITGILVFEALRGFGLSGPFFAAVILLLSACLFLLAFFAFRRGQAGVFVFAAVMVLAFIRMGIAVPKSVEPGEYVLTGTVSAISDTSARTVTVSGAKLDGRRLGYSVRLTVNSSEAPTVGDCIEARCTVREGFDGTGESSLRLLSQGVCLKARTDAFVRISGNNLPVTRWANSVRSTLKRRIDSVFPDNSSLVSGFLLGDKSEIDHDELESFRITGTAHMLSLSGFHVAILAAVLLALIPRGLRRTRFIITLLFLFLYCLITAFPASLVRASVMCACVLLAELAERRRDTLSSLSLALIAILSVAPFSLWSAGFRLSFAATFGIAVVNGEGTLGRRTGFGRLLSSMLVTLSSALATVLISSRYFGFFPTYTIPVNLLAVPAYSIAVVMCFAVLVISFPLPFAAEYIAWIPDKVLSGMNILLERLAGLPYARLTTLRPLEISGALMLVLLFVLSPYILRPLKRRLLIAAPVFLLFTSSVVLGIIMS